MATFGGQGLVVSNAVNQSRLGSYQDLIIQVKDLPDTLTVLSHQEILEAGTGVEVDFQLGKPFKYEDKLVQAREKAWNSTPNSKLPLNLSLQCRMRRLRNKEKWC
ncbi:hypothetical protein ACFUCV_14490 [Specibacter sp. NPDC057265]|uniref:hypothetical protein n=1 Tax=Specibacter sp. NPDC057265 TaxID=3346075 RepID=UPI003641EF74